MSHTLSSRPSTSWQSESCWVHVQTAGIALCSQHCPCDAQVCSWVESCWMHVKAAVGALCCLFTLPKCCTVLQPHSGSKVAGSNAGIACSDFIFQPLCLTNAHGFLLPFAASGAITSCGSSLNGLWLRHPTAMSIHADQTCWSSRPMLAAATT